MISSGEVANRLDEIRSRIERAGADPRDIEIVAVTKKFGVDAIYAAIECGVADVAENYAQEVCNKATRITKLGGKHPTWHFVGRLQRNKVKLLAPFVDLYQSVDSIALVDEIARRAPASRVFVQVDLAEQPGRGGCNWEDIATIVDHARESGLGVTGLMGVGPVGEPEAARAPFRRLAATARELELADVSMGMSADLEIAVQEGSTMLRLGSALFGSRPAG